MCGLILLFSGCAEEASNTAAKPDLLKLRNELIQLIPRATSMIPSEFEMVAEGATSDILKDVTNRSLTFALLSSDLENSDPDLRFDWGATKPSELKKHVLRAGIATWIHVENVKKVDFLVVEKGSAIGAVHFEAPAVKGRFFFKTAERKPGSWRFEEIILLGRKKRLDQNPEGKWSIGVLSGEALDRWNKIKDQPPMTP